MTYSKTEENLILLSSIPELTYKMRRVLLSELNSDCADFVKYRDFLIKSLSEGVYNKVKDLYLSADYRCKVLSGLEKRGIKCVTYFSDGYPETLKNTSAAPIVLFCKGNLSLLKTRCFAVVGSRRTLPNILKECKNISAALTDGFTVVSGMADGADSAALRGALPSGKVISVLANGFDYVYPAFNEELTQDVEKYGLLVTEYSPEVAPRSYNFPVRNRIIAGLAEATLVVSAGKRSGALITAGYALDYDRTLFAFPYTLGVASGEGCNSLLKKGGILAENILDIFSVFGLDCKPTGQIKLTDEEGRLLEIIRGEGEAFLPTVAEKLGKAPYQLIPAISSLEIKGLIVRLGGNRYSALK